MGIDPETMGRVGMVSQIKTANMSDLGVPRKSIASKDNSRGLGWIGNTLTSICAAPPVLPAILGVAIAATVTILVLALAGMPRDRFCPLPADSINPCC